MARRVKLVLAVLAGVIALCAGPCVAGPVEQEVISADNAMRLRVHQPGKFVYGLRFADKQGKHLLLLTAQDSTSNAGMQPGRIDKHRLWAVLYRWDTANSWRREWQIADAVSCPGLDSEALFLLNGVAVTDLDDDSVAEVTIPYRKFCGGGIDTKDVVVALRTGKREFVVRGQSQLIIPGQAPIGGEHEPDVVLQQAKFKAFLNHLENTWSKVASEEIGVDSK